MMLDIALLQALSDWCINVSAGWFGAAFIVPATSNGPKSIKERIVIEDLALALAFFCASYILGTI